MEASKERGSSKKQKQKTHSRTIYNSQRHQDNRSTFPRMMINFVHSTVNILTQITDCKQLMCTDLAVVQFYILTFWTLHIIKCKSNRLCTHIYTHSLTLTLTFIFVSLRMFIEYSYIWLLGKTNVNLNALWMFQLWENKRKWNKNFLVALVVQKITKISLVKKSTEFLSIWNYTMKTVNSDLN